MNAMTIDEMYRLRKKTKRSRQAWVQQRHNKIVEHEYSSMQSGIPSKLRLRACINLFSLLFILIVVVVAAIV